MVLAWNSNPLTAVYSKKGGGFYGYDKVPACPHDAEARAEDRACAPAQTVEAFAYATQVQLALSYR